MALKQEKRLLNLQTPLGENVLLLTGFRGREAISRLFQFELDLISDNNEISARQIVGKNVTFHVKLADDSPRYFNGFVSRFCAGDEDRQGRRNYQAEVVPWLWFLTRTSDCRIFQHKTVPQIIEQVFGDLDFHDYETAEIKGEHPEREYCVEYRETDFAFVSRLMEQEGIFYYFRHEQGRHVLVLGDQKGAYCNCGEDEVDYPRDYGTRAMADHITRWEHRYEFRSGKWAQTDYNFIDHPARSEPTPSDLLLTEVPTLVELDGADKYERFDYPGGYRTKDEGAAYTKIRMEEEEAGHDVVHGASNCRTFTPGGKFRVKEHRSKSEEGKRFVITSIAHEAAEPGAYETGAPAAEDYRNTFTCIPESVTFRPERTTPKPVVHGLQTAVVTGPEGEKIWPDEYGRVKVKFFWEREGKRDENSSCWVRVSQSWAGGRTQDGKAHWGDMAIPHVGDEVIVEFLEGDPDRPIIMGRVYNADHMPPLDLPENKDKRIFRDDYGNEIVLDATPDDEHIRIYSPHHKSGLELGLSWSDWTESNRGEWTIGDKFETVVGSKGEISAGSVYDFKAGLLTNATLGSEWNLLVGGSHTFDVGYRWNYSLLPDIRHAESDALTSAKEDQIVAAGDQLCLVGGANKDHRSIINAFGDSLTLSIGPSFRTRYLDKDRRLISPAKKNAAGMLYQPKPGKWWLIGGGLGFVAFTLFNTFVSLEAVDSDERPALYSTSLLSGAFAALMSILIARQVRDSTIEPVVLNRPAAKIEMKDNGQITIQSGDSEISIDPEGDIVLDATGNIRLSSQELGANRLHKVRLAGNALTIEAPPPPPAPDDAARALAEKWAK